MKKTFIKVFSAVLSLLISVCVLSVFAFADGKSTSDGFEGEKSVAFKADASDVENFIPGGRAAIDRDIYNRKEQKQWQKNSTTTSPAKSRYCPPLKADGNWNSTK